MTPPIPLLRLRDLDGSSPQFSSQLVELLDWEEYIRCLPNLQDEDLVWLVEYLDRTLADISDPASSAFRKSLHELGRICGTQEILPKSCTLSGSLLDTGLLFASGYASEGKLDGSKVCVKRVWTYTNEDPQEVKKSLYQTAAVWKRLKHQNIVPLIGITSIPLQLVSEWMPGGDLTGRIANRPHVDRLGLLSDVAEGLNYLHSCDVIHGGLKGSNIIVDANGRARITDIGLVTFILNLESIRSASAEHDHNTQWTAPEILDNRGTYSKEADVFSFAMVTIEAFTGAVPFSGKPPRAAMLAIVGGERPPRPTHPTFTNGSWILTQRCWNQEAHLRPQVSEVLQVLRSLYILAPELRIPVETGVGNYPTVCGPVFGSSRLLAVPSTTPPNYPEEHSSLNTSIPKTRPRPLNLSVATKDIVTVPLSTLAAARMIEALGYVSYPEGVSGPKPELNVNSEKGRFIYDREFLLQFMAVCTEKPDVTLGIISLDAIGERQRLPPTRGDSGRPRSSSTVMHLPMSQRASMTGFKPNSPSGFTMGNFSTPTSKMTSEERFAMSQRSTSSTVTGSGMPFGQQGPMTRTGVKGGPGSNRTRSKRGGERNKSHAGNVFNNQASKDQVANLEPVDPLEVSANGWTRKSPADEEQSVERKVKVLLNKLTMEKFDSISDRIIEWANKSEAEKDGRTLIRVIGLVFENATDDVMLSEMYARLCRKMMETISPGVRDDGVLNTSGKPIIGGQLFRKYLLDRCGEGFIERGLAANGAVPQGSNGPAFKKAVETSGKVEPQSEENHATQKARRQGLGLIQFMGELYKLQMLSEHIMHKWVKKLLDNVGYPEDEGVERLCRLLTTVGKLLDNPRSRVHVDDYFKRVKELGKNSNVAPRVQFMVQDLVELRERKWVPRGRIVAPTTIAQVHEEAARRRAQAEREAANRTLAMSRGGPRRGGDRGGRPVWEQQVDGWSVAGGSTPRPPPKAGDLSNFGKINMSGPVVMGPSSVWAGKKDTAKRDSTFTRVNSSANMFMMLGRDGEVIPETGSKPSRPSSRTSVDLGAGGTPEPRRKKLKLLPRVKPIKEANEVNSGPADYSEDKSGDDTPPAISEAEANKRIAEDIKEFFSVRVVGESEYYFTRLPSEYHHRLVTKMVSTAVESKEADGKLVADAFARAAKKRLCSISAFEEGFLPVAGLLDDIAIDAPMAFQTMATMMKGAGLDKDKWRRGRIAQKSVDGNKLLGLLA